MALKGAFRTAVLFWEICCCFSLAHLPFQQGDGHVLLEGGREDTRVKRLIWRKECLPRCSNGKLLSYIPLMLMVARMNIWYFKYGSAIMDAGQCWRAWISIHLILELDGVAKALGGNQCSYVRQVLVRAHDYVQHTLFSSLLASHILYSAQTAKEHRPNSNTH